MHHAPPAITRSRRFALPAGLLLTTVLALSPPAVLPARGSGHLLVLAERVPPTASLAELRADLVPVPDLERHPGGRGSGAVNPYPFVRRIR